MNDILDDLNSWQARSVVERRYRQQAGEEPGVDLDLVTRAIYEITCLRTTLAGKDASSRNPKGVGNSRSGSTGGGCLSPCTSL